MVGSPSTSRLPAHVHPGELVGRAQAAPVSNHASQRLVGPLERSITTLENKARHHGRTHTEGQALVDCVTEDEWLCLAANEQYTALVEQGQRVELARAGVGKRARARTDALGDSAVLAGVKGELGFREGAPYEGVHQVMPAARPGRHLARE